MKPSRHQIAAGVTVVALGALATVALASGGAATEEPSGAAAPARSAPEVRTQIVRETVHRRAKASASSGSSARGSSVRSSASPSPSPSRAAAPATTAVVPTASPDHRRRGRDDDHGRRGGDDDGFDDHGGRGGDHRFDDHDDDGHGRGRGRGRGRGGDDDD